MRRLTLLLLLLLLSCRPATTPGTLPLGAEHALDARPTTPVQATFEAQLAAPTRILLCGMPSGMYAAHRDSVDSATFLSATPRPVRGGVVEVYASGVGRVVVYRARACGCE